MSRRFSYDGDRRIARVSTQPYTPAGGNLGDPGRIKGEIDLEQELNWLSTTDRLWVWEPTDTDRLVAVYGGSADNASPPSSPLTGDVVALVGKPAGGGAAQVVWQCTYEPYGGVLAKATLAPHPRVHLGHKGLFADNLDTLEFTALEPELQPRLAARRPLLYHVRNRSLLAGEPVDENGEARVWAGGMGRFLQPDPNATGSATLDDLTMHGQFCMESSPAAELEKWTTDGMGALSCCGSSPLAHNDPSGLILGLIPGLIGPTTLGQLQSDWFTNTLEYGQSVGQRASALMEDYTFNQELDMDWASDWSQGDDMYSRSAARSEHWGENPTPGPAQQGQAMAGTIGIVRGGNRGCHTARPCLTDHRAPVSAGSA